MSRLFLVLALSGSTLIGCMRPPSPAEKFSDTVRHVAIAARFGRLDVAMAHTRGKGRETFIEQHREWGKNIRVLDTTVSNVRMTDPEHATAYVDFSWMRMNEAIMHSTRSAQVWENQDGVGWVLQRESRVAGDFGLLGENVVQAPAQRRKDVHLPSKTIRAR